MTINNILVVVAHPDDEVLGCGAFIEKLTSEGNNVIIIYFNSGCSLRDNFEPTVVLKQIQDVNIMLGTSKHFILHYPTSKFPNDKLGESAAFIKSVIDDYGIDTVLTHDEGDLHNDHNHVHRATMIASRFKGDSTVRNVLTFPVISSSDISPKWKFAPNYYVPLSLYLVQNKSKIMRIYKEEYNALKDNRGEEAIDTWAKFFGLHCNKEYAEPFRIIRSVSF